MCSYTNISGIASDSVLPLSLSASPSPIYVTFPSCDILNLFPLLLVAVHGKFEPDIVKPSLTAELLNALKLIAPSVPVASITSNSSNSLSAFVFCFFY